MHVLSLPSSYPIIQLSASAFFYRFSISYLFSADLQKRCGRSSDMILVVLILTNVHHLGIRTIANIVVINQIEQNNGIVGIEIQTLYFAYSKILYYFIIFTRKAAKLDPMYIRKNCPLSCYSTAILFLVKLKQKINSRSINALPHPTSDLLFILNLSCSKFKQLKFINQMPNSAWRPANFR